MTLCPYFFVETIYLVDMNMFARYDEIPAIALQDIKETKRYRWTDNVKTVNSPRTLCARDIIILYSEKQLKDIKILLTINI